MIQYKHPLTAAMLACCKVNMFDNCQTCMWQVQGAQQRKMHDMLDLVSATQVIQPEAIMKMLSPEVQFALCH